MDTLRIARDFGTVSAILPEGCTGLFDAPFTFVESVRVGLAYLKFQELPEDEAPPRNIWDRPDMLDEHFAAVRAKQRRKFGGKDDDEIEDPRDNGAASMLLVG